jgi:hypothetical protein
MDQLWRRNPLAPKETEIPMIPAKRGSGSSSRKAIF